jgi:Domain of unknown function (DUF5666)
MRKPSAKKFLFVVGSLALTLTAFIVGGVAMSSSAQASSANALNRNAAQSGCDKKGSECKGNQLGGPTNQTKAIFTVNSVAGNRIQAIYLEPLDKKGNTVTIITSSSTTYQPDSSVVAAGKTIFVFGTVHSDGSIAAQVVGFFDPTLVYFGGVVTKIEGSTITTQAKGSTHIIHLTASTEFFMVQPNSKLTRPASQSDLKVGNIAVVRGKLNSDGSVTATTVFIAQQGGDIAKYYSS